MEAIVGNGKHTYKAHEDWAHPPAGVEMKPAAVTVGPDDRVYCFNRVAEQICISSIALGELLYGAEKSYRPVENLHVLDNFTARLEVLAFGRKAAVHYGQIRAELERAGTPCGPYDMQIAGHARSEALIVVTNNLREFTRMPGIRAESWI